jgi:hypothetical protein
VVPCRSDIAAVLLSAIPLVDPGKLWKLSSDVQTSEPRQPQNYTEAAQPAAIYYYSKYERTFYRKLQIRYPDVCSIDEIETLFDPTRAVDLYNDVVTKATEWPTRDHSRLEIAR